MFVRRGVAILICMVRVRVGKVSLQREASRREAQRKGDRQEVRNRESAFSSCTTEFFQKSNTSPIKVKSTSCCRFLTINCIEHNSYKLASKHLDVLFHLNTEINCLYIFELKVPYNMRFKVFAAFGNNILH
jgi:hypothetical protein